MVEHVRWDDAGALDKLVEQRGAGRVAAFFCEPVIGAGGVYPPPVGYLGRGREICRRRGVLFVADEGVTRFGRLGAGLGRGRCALGARRVAPAEGPASGVARLGRVVIVARAELERIAETFAAALDAVARG